MLGLGDLLSHAVTTAVVLAVPATASVFTVRRRGGRSHVPAARAAAAATGVALAAVTVSAAAGATPGTAVAVAVLLGGSVLAWRPAGRSWAVRGLLTWALTVDAGLLYLLVVLHWTLTAHVGPAGLVASGVLWLLECFVFVLALGYVWELVDVLARRHWPRTLDVAAMTPSRSGPFVSLHVPAHNEPPDMVIETLQRLLDLEYDDYEILMVDDNTEDPALWRPVEEFCAGHDRIRFVHLENWPGYKSGALNYALSVTDPRAELVGVVDADYLVEPDFLARCAGLFDDPEIGFVQTPQDYRGWEQSGYFRRLYHSYDYFFEVSQRSRNERNGAIFGGTMGLIRRSALDEVGGWDEWCITEDAELSLRLLRAGWRGQHVDASFGRGIMPLTFEALKRQRFRWCFGGVQILRMHGRSLLPGVGGADNRLTFAQRWAYLVGGLQWFGDLAGLLFTGFLLAGTADLVLGEGLVVRRVAGFVLACVAGLVVLGAVRSIALVRRVGGATWSEAAGAFGLWLGLGWCVAQASVRGLFAREGAFLRTPKVRGDLGWRDSLRGNVVETLLAVLCLGVAAAAVLARPGAATAVVAGLLAVQGLGYAAAPLNSLAAVRADLTPELRRRRRQSLLSWSRLGSSRRGLVLAPVLGLATVLLGLVVLAAPVGAPVPGAISRALPEPATPSSTPVTQAGPVHRRSPGQHPWAGGGPRSAGPAPTTAAVPAAAATTAAATTVARPTASAAASTPTARPSATKPATPTQAATPTARPTGSPTRKPTQAATAVTAGGRPTSGPSHTAGGKP